MKHLVLIICMFFTFSPAWSANIDKGVSAALNGDYETAFAEFTPLASQGNYEAQFNLAIMFEHGLWVAKDMRKYERSNHTDINGEKYIGELN